MEYTSIISNVNSTKRRLRTEALCEGGQSLYALYVYLIQSVSHTNQIYIGNTVNLKQRLETHNSGGSLYTAKYRPWELIVFLGFKNKLKATAFEKYLKSGSGSAFTKKRFL